MAMAGTKGRAAALGRRRTAAHDAAGSLYQAARPVSELAQVGSLLVPATPSGRFPPPCSSDIMSQHGLGLSGLSGSSYPQNPDIIAHRRRPLVLTRSRVLHLRVAHARPAPWPSHIDVSEQSLCDSRTRRNGIIQCDGTQLLPSGLTNPPQLSSWSRDVTNRGDMTGVVRVCTRSPESVFFGLMHGVRKVPWLDGRADEMAEPKPFSGFSCGGGTQSRATPLLSRRFHSRERWNSYFMPHLAPTKSPEQAPC
ncbi:hypothetical protein BC628DRAFT_1026887 [Trametes gibbosa]|nr:hypothetical protein BC628DRAFT_1026887 [Trametes gibbosa]